MESALITATSKPHWDTLGHFRVLWHGVRFDHCDMQDTLGHLGTLSGIIAWSPLYHCDMQDTLGHLGTLSGIIAWIPFYHCDMQDTLGHLGTLSGIIAWSPL